MLVGNDVVDLADPENQPDAIHPRWDSRVFTAVEQARVDSARSLHEMRWKLWAAKEAAFKVAKKIEPNLSFFPTAFAVELRDRTRSVVHHEIGRFEVQWHETVEYVHAVATQEGATGAHSLIGPLSGALTRASCQVREMARRALGSLLALDPAEIEISAAAGVPVATASGSPLSLDFSLSHHGRFVACAWGKAASEVLTDIQRRAGFSGVKAPQ